MKPKGRNKPSPSSTLSSKGSSKRRRSRGSESHSPPHHRGRPAIDHDFPDMAPFDDERHCPKFRNLISRDPDVDPATEEDLDALQFELEHMLLHNVERQKKLSEEIAFLTTGDRPSTSRPKPTMTAPVFEMRAGCSGAKAKVAESATGSPSPKKLGREKVVDRIENVAVDGTDKIGRRRVFFWPQNHMPEKFWEFVEEFCPPQMMQSDVVKLNQMLKDMAEDKLGKYWRIPGSSNSSKYSLRNSIDGDAVPSSPKTTPGSSRLLSVGKRRTAAASNSIDMEEAGAGRIEKRTRSSTSAQLQQQNGSAFSNGDEQRLGPLAERLVQALIEEQQGSSQTNFNGTMIKSETNGIGTSNKALMKTLNIGNIGALERRIRKELEAQGILDDDDGDSDAEAGNAKEEDEVTTELRQRQKEMKELTERNRSTLQMLLDKTKKRIQLQKLNEDLAAADREVLQLYGKFYNLVPKRRPTGKKERDQLQDALNRRAAATKAVDLCLR